MEGDRVKIKVSIEGGPWLETTRLEWKITQGAETLTMEATPELTKMVLTKGDKVLDSFEEATGAMFEQEDRDEKSLDV